MTNLFQVLKKPRAFFLFLLAFSLFGLILIYNVSAADSLRTFGSVWYETFHQARWMVLGFLVYGACSFVPPHIWKALSPIFFLTAVVLLILVLIPGVGQEVLGAQRWIVWGPIRIQPSEITKLAVILFFASWLERHQRFAPFLLLTGIVFGLIILQPNLSTACIVAFIATLMFFFAGGNTKPLILFGALGAICIALLILAAPYRRERLTTFLNPSIDPWNKSYHIRQITVALGRGGIWGQGIGMSKQKQGYVPETSTDSIFAIYAEETGFVGSLLLISAYGVLIGTGYTIASEQKEPFRLLVAAGITTWIALHTLLNLAAMVALVPLTGIPLPLISLGGSSFVSLMMALGILTGLAREPEKTSAVHRKRIVSGWRKR